MVTTGSSPRLWGVSGHGGRRHQQHRFIPTPVGSILQPTGKPEPETVHPHACGSIVYTGGGEFLGDGSSPRLWGVWSSEKLPFFCARFIPTPVGSISEFPRSPRFCPVHPHACGEYATVSVSMKLSSGSSPRLWGVSRAQAHASGERRFIPTPVGSMRSWPGQPRSFPVHPHACGEYASRFNITSAIVGSSPRLWGVSTTTQGGTKCQRFIPTPVGSIGLELVFDCLRPVHPHACGEYNYSR